MIHGNTSGNGGGGEISPLEGKPSVYPREPRGSQSSNRRGQARASIRNSQSPLGGQSMESVEKVIFQRAIQHDFSRKRRQKRYSLTLSRPLA